MISRTSFFSAAALLAGSTQAVFRFGKCPKYEAMETFEVERYVGRWYEI